jgi:cytochrome b subunit of formate dehydrogenase
MTDSERGRSVEEQPGTEAEDSVAPAIVTKDQIPASKLYYERFDGFSRFLHLLVIISFLSLALTGMTIKFSGVSIFQTVSRIMGGAEVTGFIHRVAAIITFLYFFLHVGYLIKKKRRRGVSLKHMLTGENTLAPRKSDLVEFGQTIKWFLGVGPRPQYGRWTYWEKFDYFAVFWGILIIGCSGLLLWFPEFFTGLGIPGWIINVATIIHSDEALLATGFIFTVHFFNTHFRPDKFPMDTVIFTGRVSVEELKEDRPRHYEHLVKTGKLHEALTGPPSPTLERWARIFGFTALTIGFVTILMIIYTIFVYR